MIIKYKMCLCVFRVSFIIMDPRWKHPFTAIFADLTSCGKTVLYMGGARGSWLGLYG